MIKKKKKLKAFEAYHFIRICKLVPQFSKTSILIKKKIKNFWSLLKWPNFKKEITVSKLKNEENYIKVFKLFNFKFPIN